MCYLRPLGSPSRSHRPRATVPQERESVRGAAGGDACIFAATHGHRITASRHRPKPSRSLPRSSLRLPMASLARSYSASGRPMRSFSHRGTSLIHWKTPTERRTPPLKRPRTSLVSPRSSVTRPKTSFYGSRMSFPAWWMSGNRSGLPECRPGHPGVVVGMSVGRPGPSREFFAICVSTLGGFRHW